MRKETLQKIKNLILDGNVAAKIEEKPSDIEAVVVYKYAGLQHAAVITKDKTTDYALYRYRESYPYLIKDMHRAIKNKFSILTPWGKKVYFIAWGDSDLYRQIALYIKKHTSYYFFTFVRDSRCGENGEYAKRIAKAMGIKPIYEDDYPFHEVMRTLICEDDYITAHRIFRAVKEKRRVGKGPEVADSIQFSNSIDDKGNPNIRLVASCYGEIKAVYCRKNVSMKIQEIERSDNLAGCYEEFYREVDITINTKEKTK